MKKIILCADTLDDEIVSSLAGYADRVAVMPRWDKIPCGIGYHPDMLGFADGDRLWLNEEYYRANAAFFDGLGADVCPCSEGYGKYPCDVLFNAFAIGEVLIGREDSLAFSLKEHFASVCDVRQGYAKCSSAVFGSNVITADGGIASAARALGACVLQIEPGSVALEGYDYGFIGGALVEVSGDTLMAFGNIHAHVQGDDIVAFAAGKGYRVISFDHLPLTDHGGILSLYIR